jgi:hypothetical protein
MRPTIRKKWLALLLAGAWLPLTITCDPGIGDGIIRVVDSGWDDVVIVEEDCGWCWWGDCCRRDHFFDFDFEFDD